jgi:hypothetical protein
MDTVSENKKRDSSKYGKYIVTEMKPEIVKPPWEHAQEGDEITRVLYLDSEVVEGAFYTECAWFWPRDAAKLAKDEDDVEPHQHDHDEVLAQFGTNPDDPHDLGGELEVWLNDEKHIITRSCMIFIPKGLRHGPIRFTRIDRPVFHFAVHSGKTYLT